MAHNPDSEPHKRKRDLSDDNGSQTGHAADRIPQPPPPQSGMLPIYTSSCECCRSCPEWTINSEVDSSKQNACLVDVASLISKPIVRTTDNQTKRFATILLLIHTFLVTMCTRPIFVPPLYAVKGAIRCANSKTRKPCAN